MTATNAELLARIAELEIQVTKAKAKAKASKPFTLKVSPKGAISVYGLGSRFPVTLYRTQMEKLLSEAELIKSFIEDHAEELATKD